MPWVNANHAREILRIELVYKRSFRIGGDVKPRSRRKDFRAVASVSSSARARSTFPR